VKSAVGSGDLAGRAQVVAQQPVEGAAGAHSYARSPGAEVLGRHPAAHFVMRPGKDGGCTDTAPASEYMPAGPNPTGPPSSAYSGEW
jgi:hypothetical protein